MMGVNAPERHSAPWPSRMGGRPAVQVALGLIALALAVAVGVSWGRRTRPRGAGPHGQRPAPPQLPEAHAIWDSWRAAWKGDAEAYLACFADAARARVEGQGREALRKRLREEATAALAMWVTMRRIPVPWLGSTIATCPKCSGAMKVISVIENEDVIKKILKHLGLWDLKARPPPRKEKATGRPQIAQRLTKGWYRFWGQVIGLKLIKD